ncbi:hypothetical protein F9883_01950 [Morganella morganii]|uniref:ABC-three component system middle component 1 n=1 Tax=Morganella morganii TaxID=582 RepID=UPI0015F42B02|nr:ABC-three component system middle component 1 [Morganella morganii]MBA5806650.1 hypothetical protein [Morganella morganii]
MNRIINNILTSNGYREIDLTIKQNLAELNLFYPQKEILREEYFITVKFYNQTNESARILLESYAQEWFDLIRESGKVDQTFEKNCTLLLCHEEGNITRQSILMLEEDEYNFKKNVIAFTLKELDSLNDYLKLKNIKCITSEFINEVINENGGAVFLKFKDNNKEQENYYSLILKSVLKLPFINYQPKEKQLSNLIGDIEASFSQNQLYIYKKLIDENEIWEDGEIEQKVESIWRKLI